MYSSSTPSLDLSTSSPDEDGGFYGKKNIKSNKKRKAKNNILNAENTKPQTTIDEPEFYPLPRSARSDSHAHQTRKSRTEYMVPSPLDYDVTTRLTQSRAPSVKFSGSGVRDGAVWPSQHYGQSEIRPQWSHHGVSSSPGPRYVLPALCGRTDHDTSSSHRRAPSYSLASRHCDVTEDRTPGPEYRPAEKVYRDGKDWGPSFSLAGRRQDLTSY